MMINVIFFPALDCFVDFFLWDNRKKKKVQTDKVIYIKSLVRQSERAREQKRKSLSRSLPSLFLSMCLTPAGGSRQLEKEQ
jgi:hypothetical protein